MKGTSAGLGIAAELSRSAAPQGDAVARLPAPSGRRAAAARSGALHDPDHEPVVADEARQPLGLPGDRLGRGAAKGRRDRAHETKRIANGVTARVVHDVVTEDGEPVEVTDDWYAQDRCGNVWYLGEATTEYENGKPVSTRAPSRPGSTARRRAWSCPRTRPGMRYRQEYYVGQAEDRAEVVSLREQVEVPYGQFSAAGW